MKISWFDISVPGLGALVVLFLSWSAARSINAGRRLSSTQRRVVSYGFFFALGMGYLMLIASELHWPDSLLFVLIGAFAVLLAAVAWFQHRQARAASKAPRSTKRAADYLREGLPVAGLLVCLIGSAIEWEFVVKGQGRVIVALLWTAGVVSLIWLARRDRRATVVTALRAFLGLLVIGAIAQQNLPALAAVGVTAVVLFLVEKLWKPAPLQFESLESQITKPGGPPSSNKLQ